MHISFKKKIEEIEKILSYDLYADIEMIINSTGEPVRSKYLKYKCIYCRIMELREDFYEGSALYKIINESEEMPKRKKTVSKYRKYSQDNHAEVRDRSLTRQYFEEEEDDKSEKSYHSKIQNDKLISEGYLVKGKRNQK